MTATERVRHPTAPISLHQLSDHPYPALARLRVTVPAAWFEEIGMWMVTRRKDVVAVLRDPERFTTDHARSPIGDIFGRQMLAQDGPKQKRAKAACIQPFSKRVPLCPSSRCWPPRFGQWSGLDRSSARRPLGASHRSIRSPTSTLVSFQTTASIAATVTGAELAAHHRSKPRVTS